MSDRDRDRGDVEAALQRLREYTETTTHPGGLGHAIATVLAELDRLRAENEILWLAYKVECRGIAALEQRIATLERALRQACDVLQDSTIVTPHDPVGLYATIDRALSGADEEGGS